MLENGCFTKHPLRNGCLGFQDVMCFSMLQLATWSYQVLGSLVSPATEGISNQQKLLGSSSKVERQSVVFFFGHKKVTSKRQQPQQNNQFLGLVLSSEWNQPAFFLKIKSQAVLVSHFFEPFQIQIWYCWWKKFCTWDPYHSTICILRDSKMGVGLGRFIHLFVSEIPNNHRIQPCE